MKVIMLKTTGYDCILRKEGTEQDVAPEVAERWAENGIAEITEPVIKEDTSEDISSFRESLFVDSDGITPKLLNKDDLGELLVGKLKAYAEAHEVAIGNSSSVKGILNKIVKGEKVLTEED